MISLYPRPKVITLSGFHCNTNLTFSNKIHFLTKLVKHSGNLLKQSLIKNFLVSNYEIWLYNIVAYYYSSL
jgi:hypothetical protein